MGRLKDFVKEHKVTICIVGGVIAVGTAAYLMLRNSGETIDLSGKSMIYWDPNSGEPMALDRVKEIIEANKGNAAKYAILRDGPNPNEYTTIMLDNDLVVP